MDALLKMVIYSIASIALEWILLLTIEISTTKPFSHKILKIICKGVLVCSILFYIAVTLGISLISVHYFKCGDMATGLKMAITAIIVMICAYYLFLRIPIKKVSAMK